MLEFFSFGYTDNLTSAEEVVIYEKLKFLGILTPSFETRPRYQYIKKSEVSKLTKLDF